MILLKVTYRHYLRHPWQIVFSIIGVSLGVAVVIAIDLANYSANKSLELTSVALEGRATHQIVGGPQGLPEKLYVELRQNHHIKFLAPILSGYGDIVGAKDQSKTMQIMGVDVLAEISFREHFNKAVIDFEFDQFLSAPNTALMLKSAADQLGLSQSSEFTLQVRGIGHKFTLAGFINDQNPLTQESLESILFVDIATAQEILGMQGLISQIDLIISNDNNRNKIEQLLPVNAKIISSHSKSRALSQMTSAFQLNLKALSMLALLVGIFLIYNTMTFSVVQRKTTLGNLRVLGVTGKQIFTLIILEALVIGVLATLLGVGLGILLGKGLLIYVTRTINDLYFLLTVNSLYITPLLIVKGIIIGVLATVVAVIKPAYEASRNTPISSMSRSDTEEKFLKGLVFLWRLGLLLGVLGCGLFAFVENNLMVAIIGLFLVIMGFAFLIPTLALWMIRFITPLLQITLGQLGMISARNISVSFSHMGIAITTLTIAIATTIGVAVMIDSFRYSVVDWLDSTLSADIYVSAAGATSYVTRSDLSPKWLDKFMEISEIETISIIRQVQLRSSNGTVRLNVLKVPNVRLMSFKLIEGQRNTIRSLFNFSDVVLISEPYAFRHSLRGGDSLVLTTDVGEREFQIIGIYTDYESEQGVVSISRSTYLKYWNDYNISSFEIYARPGVDIPDLISIIRATVVKEFNDDTDSVNAEQMLTVRSNRALREASIKIFDRTFDVTQVLRLLAIIVAFVGILSALMAIQLEREKELALLRAIGLTPKQIWMVISGETGLIGVIVGVLAVPLGIVLAAILVFIINRRSFGWTMDFTVDYLTISLSVLMAIVAALLAGLIPAYRMSRIKPAIAIREQ